jgi:hypothetical protein
MITSNPIADIPAYISPLAMQAYVVVMALLVVVGTVVDMLHKKSARYFFESSDTRRAHAERSVGLFRKLWIAVKTLVVDVLASGEFCNSKRRVAHLLTMYGFILFIVTTVILVFAYPSGAAPELLSVLWHVGALMVCVGGYWFWFGIRVDVAAEGHPWYRVVRADLFILSLLATTTLALLWSLLQWADAGIWTLLFFWLFVVASTILFGGVFWSKFAHMFYKPAAAFQRRVSETDGSRDNLPPPADEPEKFGLGISRELPRHY